MTNAEASASADYHRLFALDQEVVGCPYPTFARLRSSTPVLWVDEIEAFTVTRYEDIIYILKHPALFSSALVTGPILARQMEEGFLRLASSGDADVEHSLAMVGRSRRDVLLSADPPLHGRQRSLVSRAFTQRRVRQFEDSIETIASELVGTIAGQEEVEFVAAFAVPLPLSVIADRLGVPRSNMAEFKKWSDHFTVAIGNHHLTADELRLMLISQAEFFEYFEVLVEERQRDPKDDLLSDLANSTLEDGDALSIPEILSMLAQFLVAGNETTTKLLTFCAHRLAQSPELANRLREDPALIESYVEEVLRLEAPVQGLYRVAVEDCEIGGVAVPAGSPLWLAYASANHDDSAFPVPDELHLDRSYVHPHLSFGFGEHFCLGAALSRAETRIGLRLLLERFHSLRLHPRNRFEFEHSYALHGLRELWLTVEER